MDSLSSLYLILDSALRLSVPLLFAAMAGLYSERSGVFDIGLEGKMLVAAFAAGAVASLSHSPWIGLLAAIGASTAFALLHAFACITHRGNQIVSGVAINILALGLTAQLGHSWFAHGGQTPQLDNDSRFLSLEGPAWLVEIPFGGPFMAEVLSGHNILVYIALGLAPLSWWVLYRSRFGLQLRAVGENPAAVDTAGISVNWLRYRAVIYCGVLCGFAGAYLSIAQNAGFIRDMTAGKGFIALAALIFANWRPMRVLGACFLFGLLDAMAIRLQGVALPLIGEIPVQLMQAVPYVLTIVLLAGFVGRASPPRAAGTPYVKEHG